MSDDNPPIACVPTEIVSPCHATLNSPALYKRLSLRNMSADEFIDKHGSGTLRKNKRIGMNWKEQYIHERVAYEFGWVFECIHADHIGYCNAITEGDSKPITEAGWHIERYLQRNVFLEDKFTVKYLYITSADAPTREGVGMILTETSAPFIPAGHVVCGIVAPKSTCSREYEDAINPA